MKILIFGGEGQLGQALFRAASERGHSPIATGHKSADVTHPITSAFAVRRYAPDAVVNCAAYHHLQSCEENPEQAFQVNVYGAANVAHAAKTGNARHVFISTDYVFSKQGFGIYESDPQWPLQVYGESKSLAERTIKMIDPNSIIIRTSNLYGKSASKPNFVERVLQWIDKDEHPLIVYSQTIIPTYTEDLAGRIIELLERSPEKGAYHITNNGRCTPHEFATEIARQTGYPHFEFGKRADHPDGIARPSNSVLMDTRMRRLNFMPLRHWTDALAAYLKER